MLSGCTGDEARAKLWPPVLGGPGWPSTAPPGSVPLAPTRAGLQPRCQGPAVGQQLFLAEKGGGAALTLGDRDAVTPARSSADPWGPGRRHPDTEQG